MTIEQYQKMAVRTALAPDPSQYSERDLALVFNALGLVGEAGEVADTIKKGIAHKHGLDIIAVKKELGDTMWYMVVLADLLKISLESIMQTNIEKLNDRYPQGYSSEDSKQRRDVLHWYKTPLSFATYIEGWPCAIVRDPKVSLWTAWIGGNGFADFADRTVAKDFLKEYIRANAHNPTDSRLAKGYVPFATVRDIESFACVRPKWHEIDPSEKQMFLLQKSHLIGTSLLMFEHENITFIIEKMEYEGEFVWSSYMGHSRVGRYDSFMAALKAIVR